MSAEQDLLVEAIRLTARHTPEAKGDSLYVVAWDQNGDATEGLWRLHRTQAPRPWPGTAVGFSELAHPVLEAMGGGQVGPSGFMLKLTVRKATIQPLMINEVENLLYRKPWDIVLSGLPQI
jgi:hypothetical protein